MTYAQATINILDFLASINWKISKLSLKVPHATSPDGALRLWFRPQAVWFTTVEGNQRHEYCNARRIRQLYL